MVKFYKCLNCGNVIVKLIDGNIPVMCCGSKMKELVPNTTDAAGEKHVPVVEVNGNIVKVTVGEVIHPMTEAHLINFVALETNKGLYVHHFKHTDEPITEFTLAEGEEVIKVYEYCNLHGLWAK